MISLLQDDMETSTVTSKGQITIPKAVRDRMRLKAGDKLEFRIEESGMTSVRRARPAENPFEKFRGIARGAFKNRKEINAWIAEMRDPE